MSKEHHTKVVDFDFNGMPMFAVLKVDEKDQLLLGEKAVVKFGIRRATAILQHLEELQEFVKKNSYLLHKQ